MHRFVLTMLRGRDGECREETRRGLRKEPEGKEGVYYTHFITIYKDKECI